MGIPIHTGSLPMKIRQLTATDESLVLQDVPDPVPGPKQVALDVRVAGPCTPTSTS
jgi:NADPH:quinone reductase-like Zn-dependent oxidoreductase